MTGKRKEPTPGMMGVLTELCGSQAFPEWAKTALQCEAEIRRGNPEDAQEALYALVRSFVALSKASPATQKTAEAADGAEYDGTKDTYQNEKRICRLQTTSPSMRGSWRLDVFASGAMLQSVSQVKKQPASAPATWLPKGLVSHVLSVPLATTKPERGVILAFKRVVHVQASAKQRRRVTALMLTWPKSSEGIEVSADAPEKLRQLSGGTAHCAADLLSHTLGQGEVCAARKATFWSSTTSSHSIKCLTGGVNEGRLFPLSAGFLFVHKPLLFIPLDSVKDVRCPRAGKHSTLVVDYADESSQPASVEFSMVPQDDIKQVKQFLHAAWSNKSAADDSTEATSQGVVDDDDDSEDSDVHFEESESDSDIDYESNSDAELGPPIERHGVQGASGLRMGERIRARREKLRLSRHSRSIDEDPDA